MFDFRAAEIREKLASSLVMLGEIGGNDYNYAFLQMWPTAGGYGLDDSISRMVKTIELATELIPEVAQAISNAAKVIPCRLQTTAHEQIEPFSFTRDKLPITLT